MGPICRDAHLMPLTGRYMHAGWDTFTVNTKCLVGKVNYTDLSMSYCFMNQCKPKIKKVKLRLVSTLVTSLTKPNCSWASLPKVDHQYFVHILFTTQSMIRYCRMYMHIFPRLYLPSMSKLLSKTSIMYN